MTFFNKKITEVDLNTCTYLRKKYKTDLNSSQSQNLKIQQNSYKPILGYYLTFLTH